MTIGINHERFMRNVNRALVSKLGDSCYIKMARLSGAMDRFVRENPDEAINLYVETKMWRDNRAEKFRGIAVGDEKIRILYYLEASNVVGLAIINELNSNSRYAGVVNDVKRDMGYPAKDAVYVSAGDDLEAMEERLFANPPQNIYRDDTRNVARSDMPGIWKKES